MTGNKIMFKRIITPIIILMLTGCAGAVSGLSNLYTRAANGFQDITVDIDPKVAEQAKFEEIGVRVNPYMTNLYLVHGYITYKKSCKGMRVESKVYSKDKAVLGTATALIMNYTANEKTKFEGQFGSMPANAEQLLSSVRISGISCF